MSPRLKKIPKQVLGRVIDDPIEAKETLQAILKSVQSHGNATNGGHNNDEPGWMEVLWPRYDARMVGFLMRRPRKRQSLAPAPSVKGQNLAPFSKAMARACMCVCDIILCTIIFFVLLDFSFFPGLYAVLDGMVMGW